MSQSPSPYDSQFFESFPSPERHPQRLAAVATLFGLTPPPLESSKILEIGCGTGMHVIAQALDLHGAEFVALDHSREQIHKARQMALQAGCPNIKFIHADITERFDIKGTFDYVLCHGLYAWTTKSVQEAILNFIKERLSPHGLCAISYNCLPGWSVRSGIHAMLSAMDNTGYSDAKRIAQARELLHYQLDLLVDVSEHHEQRLKTELERCLQRSDGFILHELLNPASHGYYLKDVVEQCAAYGLSYVGDMRPQRMHRPSLRDDVKSAPEKLSSALEQAYQYESLYDNIYPQALRNSIFCRQDRIPQAHPVRESVLDFFISSPLVPLRDPVPVHDDSIVEFGTPNSDTIDVQNRLLKASLTILHRQWPNAVRGSELFELSRQMIGETGPFGHLEEQFCNLLLRQFPVQNVEFYVSPLRAASVISEFPRVSSLVRYQAKSQNWVTSLRHEVFSPNELHRRIIELADGKTSVDDMYETLLAELQQGTLKIQEEGKTLENYQEAQLLLREGVSNGLEELLEAALLIDS